MRLIACIGLLTWSLLGWAQSFTARVSKSTVSVGERFQVVYTAEGNANHFQAPKFPNFQVLSGPNTSTSMQWVNGNYSSSKSYSFILRALEEGSFSIDPASIQVNGKKMAAGPIQMTVVKTAANQRKQGRNSTNVNTQNAASEDISSNLFMKMFVDKKDAYVGEQIIATYKLYLNTQVINYANNRPVYNGFYAQELDIDPNTDITTEHINGKNFRVATMKKVVLTPQQTGEFEIPPLEMQLQIRVQDNRRGRSIFDQMFGSYRNIKVDVSSNSEKVSISPLPSKNQPGDFTGAVGDFDISMKTDRTEVNVNEAVNLTITVEGKGNIELVGEPKITFPGDFETYEPKTRQDIAVNGSGTRGKKIFEYVLIPRYAGDFELKPFTFSYFEPSSGTYKRLSSEPIELSVIKGEGNDNYAADEARFVAPKKEDVQIIGSDIRFIKSESSDLHKVSDSFFGSPGFVGMSTVPVAGMGLSIFLLGLARKRQQDTDLLKSRKAKGLAKKRLTSAGKLINGDDKAFYEEIFRALYGYLGDKFGIPVSELHRESIDAALHERNVSEDLSTQLRKALDECEMARFAPGVARGKQEMFNLSSTLIEQLENEV